MSKSPDKNAVLLVCLKGPDTMSDWVPTITNIFLELVVELF